MITAVDFLSLDEFSKVQPALDMLAISIGDPNSSVPENLTGFQAKLRLEFLDLTSEDILHYGIAPSLLCEKLQIQQLISFIEKFHESPASFRAVVHCQMGLSRSAAIALTIEACTQCEFPRKQDSHFANTHVIALAQELRGSPIKINPQPKGLDPHIYLPSAIQI